MWSASDVARLLDVHINTVRRWTNCGLIKSYRIGHRGDRRFLQRDVVDFLVERNQKIGKAHNESP